MYHTIYCDMDGVLFDFHTEAVRAHMRCKKTFSKLEYYGAPIDLTWEYLHSKWELGKSLQKFLPTMNNGEPNDDGFWKPLDEDPLFWHSIQPYPWFKDLLQLCHDHAKHVVLCTYPRRVPNAYSGKIHSLGRAGLDQMELHTCREKWRLSRKGALLIDDHERVVNAWVRKSEFVPDPGEGILFPAPWNENHPYRHDPVGYVRNILENPDAQH